MKKLINVLVTMVLFSCTQENLPIEEQKTILSRPGLENLESIPDVYAVDGILHLKNLNAVDSIMSLISNMSTNDRLYWEKTIGFESAVSYYDPYLEAYDSLTNEEEIDKFIQKNKDILNITRDEDGEVDVDYPFEDQTMLSILSKNGRVYIGKSLFICKKDRRIDINGYTNEKIIRYENATQSNPTELVFVNYPETNILTKNEYGTANRTITYYRHPESGYETRNKKSIRYAVQSYIIYNNVYNNTQWEINTYVSFYVKCKRRKQNYSSSINIDSLETRTRTTSNYIFYGNFINNNNKGGKYFNFFKSSTYYQEQPKLVPSGTVPYPDMKKPNFSVKFKFHSAAFTDERKISVTGSGDNNLMLTPINRFI